MIEYLRNNEMTYEKNPYYDKNVFASKSPETCRIPKYKEIANQLPKPVFEGHEDYIACYNKTWQIAFENICKPAKGSGFVSDFIDTAFNGCLFMWDSSFIMMFTKYAERVFPFQKTLDNFYALQHKDGFICREIKEDTGLDRFTRFDPAGTGPNILPLSEWLYFENTGDLKRLEEVYNPLRAYHIWLKKNHTWRDGSYFSSGWGCGMDNVPRLAEGYHVGFSHGRMIWVDTCMQQLMNAGILIKMNKALGGIDDVSDLEEETERLSALINDKLWDDKTQFYYDLWENDELNMVKHLGAYWSLIAGIVPKNRLDGFVAHLENENEFKRPNRIPTLSADHPKYCPTGGYWCGSVWAPTNYMVLRGLTANGYHELAYEIGNDYLKNVVEVFGKTGTVYENYAPESAAPGNPAKGDFVGWTGLAPISVFFEYVLGILPMAAENKIIWNIHRTEKHGIQNYPFGNSVTLDLICERRASADDEPVVHISGNAPVEVVIRWNGKEKTVIAAE